MQLGQPLLLLGDGLLQLRDLAVAQLRRALQVGGPLRPLGLAASLLEPRLRRLDRLDRLLLVLPARFHLAGALAQLGQLGLERLEARLRGLVALFLQRLALDLQLLHAAFDLVDLGRHRVDLDLQPRGRLVDQVDRLVGQEAVGDVALREGGRGDDRRVGDPHPVVDLVALLQPAQDRDRVGDVGLAHVDRLEAPLQGRVLLDVLAVLVERRRPDRAQLAAGQHRLQQVGGVDRALGRAGADDRVQLVEEEDDLPLRVLHLGEHRFQPLLELAAVFRAGQQRADVERDHAAVAQALRHVAVDDPLRQPLDDRRLADPGVADQHRVVLGAAGEHLDHPADLLVAADHRVELPRLRLGGQVAAEFLQRLDAVLRVRRGDLVRAAHLGDRLFQRAAIGEDVGDARALVGQRQEDVLGRDVLVAELGHLALGLLEDADQRRGGSRLRLLAAHRRQGVGRLVRLRPDRGQVGAELLQDRHDQPVGLVEQGDQQVGRGDLGVAPLRGELLRRGDGFLGLDGEPVRLHQLPLSFEIRPSSSAARRRIRSSSPLIFSTRSSIFSSAPTPARLRPCSEVIRWMRRRRSTSRCE